jgi:hypothetical protein
LKIAGLDPTFSGGVGSEQISYQPTADGAGYASGVLRAYARGQQYDLTGAYADGFTLEFELGGVPKITFPLQGISSALPSDVSVPSITYPTVLPPKASALALSLGGYSPARVRSGSLTFKRNISPRLFDVSAQAHGGFSPGVDREATLEVVIEAAALSSFNPYTYADAQTALSLAATIGGTQYNKFTLNAANAQLLTADEAEEGPVATWALSFALKASTVIASDEFTLVWQ